MFYNRVINVYRIMITSFLSLLFIGMGGITKLTGMQFQRNTFEHYGYSVLIMYFIGSLELILGILILIPRTRIYAACGMVLITVGVLYSAWKIGEFGFGIILSPPSIVMMLALSLIFILYEKDIRS